MRAILDIIERVKSLHRFVVCSAQLGIFALSAVSAFLLRFDFTVPPAHLAHLAYAVPLWMVLKGAVFHVIDLDRGWWRYVSVTDLMRLLMGNLIGSALGCLAILFMAPTGFPRSIYLLDLILSFLGTAGLRVIVRMTAENSPGQHSSTAKNTLIYGAGDAGAALLREIQRNARLAYRVCGFLDDRPAKQGARILGVPVLGGGDDTGLLVKKHQVESILIAIPSATGSEMTRILKVCHAAGTECKTVPGLGEVIEKRGLARQLRQVAVEDLLGRTPVRLDVTTIRAQIEGRVVLVTGAAGSIGSELCRQVAAFRPARIVGYEIAETALFQLEQEMRHGVSGVPFMPEIGSIQNTQRLADVFRQHRPDIVFHAAAYKHVPMMEAHPFEAVENNIFGTWNVATTSAQHGARDFVMISSDKAVRPASIMGLTKRAAELVVGSLQNHSTKFVAVRFGNVLGSNGSVIPIFKMQIAAGGPVTVTHPEMRRYFMTIPEAVQLVLQASTMGKGGEIFVLDMGQPIKILDLARNLILLSGLQPEEDIRIQVTGIRPGEKIYEELSTLLENTVPTDCEKIKIFAGGGVTVEEGLAWLAKLRQLCAARDARRLILELKEMVPEYNPSMPMLHRILDEEPEPAVAA